MSFGQQLGPPASHRQIKELLELLQAAGHATFRDARGPMGFTQRQGGGKFTANEAETYINQLNGDREAVDANGPIVGTRSRAVLSTSEQLLKKVPAEQLAMELERRGWVVIRP